MMRSIKITGGPRKSSYGITTPNIHRCSYIHNGVTDLTSANRKICDQHIQLISSRISCDNKDIAIVKDLIYTQLLINMSRALKASQVV